MLQLSQFALSIEISKVGGQIVPFAERQRLWIRREVFASPDQQVDSRVVDAHCKSKRTKQGMNEICRDVCDGDAIPEEQEVVRGVLKYTIDPYKCLPYFAKTDGCAKCISRCAFNRKPEELRELIATL